MQQVFLLISILICGLVFVFGMAYQSALDRRSKLEGKVSRLERRPREVRGQIFETNAHVNEVKRRLSVTEKFIQANSNSHGSPLKGYYDTGVDIVSYPHNYEDELRVKPKHSDSYLLADDDEDDE